MAGTLWANKDGKVFRVLVTEKQDAQYTLVSIVRVLDTEPTAVMPIPSMSVSYPELRARLSQHGYFVQ